MRKSILSAILILLPAVGSAAPGDAQCAMDLSRANTLVAAVAGRDKGGPYKPEAICGVLRANLRDMREAAIIMRRCMTGHAFRENVGQMEASMEDVQAAISRRCR